jgi:hypothetical protein
VRIALATVATVIALPLLVSDLTSGEDGAAPVAAVPGGADIAGSLRAAASSAATGPAAVSEQRSNLPQATSPTDPAVLEIAVPDSLPASSAKGLAGYRHLGRRGGVPACASPLAPVGARVTIVNVDNGHQVTCLVTTPAVLRTGHVIAVDSSGFVQLSDPVQNPIPVRITW